MIEASAAPGRPRALVWDAPVRVAHAAIIIGVAGAWLTRDPRDLDLHAVFGYIALAAAAFRLAWGFVGAGHARFASFAYSPAAALRYLRAAVGDSPHHYTGHNPAGSWAVYALLALLLAGGASGILAIGAMHALGPLGGNLPYALAEAALAWHQGLAWAILALVVLHLAGVAWGSHVHRESLALAMVTGRKAVHGAAAPPVPARGVLAAALAAAALGFAAYYLAVAVPADVGARAQLEASRAAALKASPWGAECGSCHLAYLPALMPLRTWRRTLAEQERHFGEDLGLDDAAVALLLGQAAKASPPGWAAWQLAASVPEAAAPLRITHTRAWREIHQELPAELFREPLSHGRHDCEACHRDAASGIFHPRMIRIPKPKVAS